MTYNVLIVLQVESVKPVLIFCKYMYLLMPLYHLAVCTHVQFFYRSIASIQFQPYLNVLTVTKISQALSKLRVSSHRLEIEAGRWVRRRIPVNERKYTVCQVVED